MTIKKILIPAFLSLLGEPAFAATHDSAFGTWISVPRAAISIVIDDRGARMIGPGWQRQFIAATNKPVRINLDENSWFELRLRPNGVWEGTYFHPAVRPEEQGQFKRHLMLLTRRAKGPSRPSLPAEGSGAARGASASCVAKGC